MDAKIAAIVLAAGRSSRLAPRNKLLETVGGQAIVARVASCAIASGADPVVVVTGFEAARVAEALSDLNVVVVHNPAFAEGLSGSLRTGLEALPADCDGALILLGDMPKIESSVLNALIARVCRTRRDLRSGAPGQKGQSHPLGRRPLRRDDVADRRCRRQAPAAAARSSRARSAGRVFRHFRRCRYAVRSGAAQADDRIGEVSTRADARAARSRARSKAPARSASASPASVAGSRETARRGSPKWRAASAARWSAPR